MPVGLRQLIVASDVSPAARRRARGIVLVAAAVCALNAQTGVWAAEPVSEALRARFREAYFAASTGAALSDERDDAALRDYVLYPYLEAARIAKALSLTDAAAAAAQDAAAAAFLSRHAGEPVADGLGRAWLESLARRGLKADLLDRYRPGLATARLECQWLVARIELGARDGLGSEILQRWLTPAQLPLECEPAFEWARSEGILDEAWTERRLRLLLESGQAVFARVIARRLPAERAAPWLVWADLIEDPAGAIDRLIADPLQPVDFDALLDGFSRLATADPDAGLEAVDRLIEARSLDAQESSRLRRALAYGLAWDRDARALDYFARIDERDLDDYTLQWRARSALWAGDWALAAASIDALSPELRETPAWRYWAARAARELGDASRARELFESILATDNYYSALAAARLGRRVIPHAERFDADEAVVESIERLEPMIRARELRAVSLPSEALSEWRYAQSMLDAEAQRQSVHVAAHWGWYDVAIATATSHEIFFDYRLLYPRPFSASVAAAARLTRLDAPLIYGVMRQESLFRADAASGAGAIGLMQIVPDTARRTAASWNRPAPSRDALFEPETNVILGAAHLRSLADRFDLQLPVALAAYNAGPAAAAGWLPDTPVDADVWIENIPYNETRAYVRRVLWHSVVFKWLAEHRPQDAASWLGQISPPQDGD